MKIGSPSHPFLLLSLFLLLPLFFHPAPTRSIASPFAVPPSSGINPARTRRNTSLSTGECLQGRQTLDRSGLWPSSSCLSPSTSFSSKTRTCSSPSYLIPSFSSGVGRRGGNRNRTGQEKQDKPSESDRSNNGNRKRWNQCGSGSNSRRKEGRTSSWTGYQSTLASPSFASSDPLMPSSVSLMRSSFSTSRSPLLL